MYRIEKPPRAISGLATGFLLSATLWIMIGTAIAIAT